MLFRSNHSGWSRQVRNDSVPSNLMRVFEFFAGARVRRALVLVIASLALLHPVVVFAVGDRGADGQFERRESFHFNLYQDVDIDEAGGIHGSRRFEQKILAELEGAFDLLDQLLSLRPERKLDVYVWDSGIFDARFSGLFRFPAAGFYGGAIHIRGGTRLTPSLIRVLHHELVHAAFDAEAPRPALPAWMNEGIAEWFEARAVGKRSATPQEKAWLADLAAQGQLFSLSEMSGSSLGGFGPNAARVAYLESYVFIDFLVKTRGEDGLVRFWSTLVRSRSLERAARRTYRATLEELERDFRQSLSGG